MNQSSFLDRCHQAYREQLQRCNDPFPVAEAMFHDLMNQLDSTLFYHDHDLSKVKTLEQFKQQVPIRGYHDFDQYIDLMVRGAQNVLTKSKAFAFYKTSGTSGKSKLIPSTYHWRQAYRGPALYTQWGLYFKLIRMKTISPDNVLDISWTRKPLSFQNEFPVYSITSRPSALDGNDWLPPWHESEWFFDDSSADVATKNLDMLVQRAFTDVRIIVAVNPSKIVYLYDLANERQDDLIAALHARLEANPKDEAFEPFELLLEKVNRGERLTLKDLWPNLSLLVCWLEASAGKYKLWLDQAAPEVPFVPFSSVGTEGIVTIPVDSSQKGSALAINQGIYEFVDVSELEDPGAALPPYTKTLNFNELKVGGRYRLVMTQANGIYRYDTADVYQVQGWVGGVPRIEFVGRSNVGSSFTGEKLSEDDVFQSMRRLAHHFSASTPMHSLVPCWGQPPGYTLIVEDDAKKPINTQLFASELQREMCQMNEEYAEKCASARLTEVSVQVLKPGAFSKLNQQRVAAGISAAQVKHLWIQKDDAILKDLQALGLLRTESMECVA